MLSSSSSPSFGPQAPLPSAYLGSFTEPEKLLTAHFNSSSVGLCILDSELRYIAINKKLAQINGQSPENHLGKSVRQILGDFADLVEPKLRWVLSTAESICFEASAVLPTRPELASWIIEYIPVCDVPNVVTRVAAVVLEIPDRIKATESFYESAENLSQRLRLLLDVGETLLADGNVTQLFLKLSACLRRVFLQEYAAYATYDGGLLIRQAEDFPLGKGHTANTPIECDSPGGRAVESRSVLIYSPDELRNCKAKIAHEYLAEGLRSLCCVPILRAEKPVGVLLLGSTRNNAFRTEDLPLLKQVATQFGVALNDRHGEGPNNAAIGVDLKLEIPCSTQFPEIVGDSKRLRDVFEQLKLVAPTEATVLILGETGTGKELIARAIHGLSARKNQAFIKVNCAAIPLGLLESELFGHEKGAFTGAISQKVGRIELAHKGTLFLDEIGDIPLELQPKLLRVLQEQEFERLGSTRTIKVNVRFLAATNRDLQSSMITGTFRSDLYYRIHVFPISLPPLRDRRDDILPLLSYFVAKFAKRMNRRIEVIPQGTINALRQWLWPGNIRELENLIERSVILSKGPILDVPLSELQGATSGAELPVESLDDFERQQIIRILAETKGRLSGRNGAAERLGLKRTTLQSKMQRLGITAKDYTTVGLPKT